MPRIQVRTSQNVQIDYNIAGVGDRILATLLDLLIMGSYLFIVVFAFGLQVVDELYLTIALFLPVFFYHLICEIFMNGQSIGKRQLKIQVIKLDGSRPSLGAYIARWIFRIFDTSLFFFYGAVAVLSIVLTKNGQRIGDLVAGTTVIKLTTSDLSSNPINQEFSGDYEPQYPEVIRLTDDEIDLIDKALAFNRTEANSGPAELLAEKLAAKMSVKIDIPIIKFLHTVKKDYNHITSQ